MNAPLRTPDLRLANTQTILRYLYLNGPTSRLDLSDHTNLSPGTITNVTSEMLHEGVLIEKGLEESYGGRPRTILDINPDYCYVVGVSIGETQIQMGLYNLKQQELANRREDVLTKALSINQLINIIDSGYLKLLASSGVPENKIMGMGIGVPGIVSHNGKVNANLPMWGWKPAPLLEMIEKKIHLPVYIDNGAKLMALAESWFGAGRGVQNMIVVVLGTGIGAGIITKGTLYRGSTNSAGEWGHTKIALEGRPCRCGGHGCLEAYIGAPGIIASWYEATAKPRPEEPVDQLKFLTELLKNYQDDEPCAIQVLNLTTKVLGIGIANLVNIFNPELIVIGGWVGLMIGNTILHDLKKIVKENSLPLSNRELQIRLCHFGADAVCVGAVCTILQEALSGNQKFYPRGRQSQK